MSQPPRVEGLLNASGVATSVEIVESFYGEPISGELLHTIADTPSEQLLILADRVVKHGAWVEESLEIRGYSSGNPYKSIREASLPKGYNVFTSRNIVCHDSTLMRGGIFCNLDEIGELAHLILYSEKFLVPDFILYWADQVTTEWDAFHRVDAAEGPNLARHLATLQSLLPLIRAGVAVPVMPGSHFSMGLEYADIASRFDGRVLLTDPFLAWYVANRTNLIPEWERQQYRTQGIYNLSFFEEAERALERLRPDGEPTAMELSSLGGEISGDLWAKLSPAEVQNMLSFAFIIRSTATSPLSAAKDTLTHIQRGGAVLLDDDPGLISPTFKAAVEYRLPSLRHASLSDLIRLRLNEEVFHELRGCLDAVAISAEHVSLRGGYGHFRTEFSKLSEDLVRPTYEKIQKMKRKASIRSLIWGAGTSGAISLGLSGAARLLGVPRTVASGPARGVGQLAGKQAKKRLNAMVSDCEVAGSALLSLLDPSE